MATKQKQIHVLLDRDTNTWYGLQSGGLRKSFAGQGTQHKAIDLATQIAKNQNIELVVHRKDNARIRERNSYGKDPFPPRG